MAALPSAVPAALLLDELRRLRERQAQSQTPNAPPNADFVCDANGTVSQTRPRLDSMVIQSIHGQVIDTVAATVVTVTGAAASAAGATSQAATRAAEAAMDAASRAAVSARDTVSSWGRHITNADRAADLRSQATDLAAFQGSREWMNLMRALFAVGIAIAAADGEISEVERHAIEEFVGGAGYSKLPAGLKADIQTWLARPPTIEEAFAVASKCDEEGLHQIENVLEVIIHSDEVIHPAEIEFREKWRDLREAATS